MNVNEYPNNSDNRRQVIAIGGQSPQISQTIMNGDLRLHGWAMVETSGSATALVNLYDGNNNQGQFIAAIALTAGQSTREPLFDLGIVVKNALFVEVVSGTVRCSFWVEDI